MGCEFTCDAEGCTKSASGFRHDDKSKGFWFDPPDDWFFAYFFATSDHPAMGVVACSIEHATQVCKEKGLPFNAPNVEQQLTHGIGQA